MKKRYFIVAALFATLTLVIFSCREELFDQIDESAESEEIMEARQWYNSNRPEGVRLKSLKANRVNIGATPQWKHAFTTKHSALTTVEVPLNTQKQFGYASKECENAFKQTGDQRYMSSLTVMVVAKEKKNKRTTGFLMTYVPDKAFREKTKFKPFKSSYLKWNKDYSGYIFYHDLDGNFINGWEFFGGKPVKTLKPLGTHNGGNIDVRLKSTEVCTTYFIAEYTRDCTVSIGYDPSTGEIYNVEETCGERYLTKYEEFEVCKYVEGEVPPTGGGVPPGGVPPIDFSEYYVKRPILIGRDSIRSFIDKVLHPDPLFSDYYYSFDITDINSYLKCYSLSNDCNTKVSICVKAPGNYSMDYYDNGSGRDYGWSYISIEQQQPNGNIIFRTFRFYPQLTFYYTYQYGQNIESSPSCFVTKILEGDGFPSFKLEYDIQLTREGVTGDELNGLLNYVKYTLPNLSFSRSFNDASAAIECFKQVGVYLHPNPQGPYYSGSLYYLIKDMPLPSNTTRTELGYSSQENYGTCQ